MWELVPAGGVKRPPWWYQNIYHKGITNTHQKHDNVRTNSGKKLHVKDTGLFLLQLYCFLGSRLSSLKVLQRAMMGRKMVEIKWKGKDTSLLIWIPKLVLKCVLKKDLTSLNIHWFIFSPLSFPRVAIRGGDKFVWVLIPANGHTTSMTLPEHLPRVRRVGEAGQCAMSSNGRRTCHTRWKN